MTRAERDEVLSTAVSNLEEPAKLLRAAGEELLPEQANELGDRIIDCGLTILVGRARRLAAVGPSSCKADGE